MPDPFPEPVPYPHWATAAWLTAVLAGVSVFFCGLQLLVFMQLPNAIAWGPAALALLGVAQVLSGAQVGNIRVGSTVATLVTSVVSLLVVSGVSVYLLAAGVFSPLFFLSPLTVAVATLLLITHLPSARRYVHAQDAIRKHLAELEASSPSGLAQLSPFSKGPEPSSGGAKVLAALATILLTGWLPLAILAPVAFNRLMLQSELLAGGTWPSSAAGFVDARGDYPYPTSSFLDYIAYERKFVDFDAAGVGAFADRIAEDVGWQMMLEADAGSVQEAEATLWEAGRAQDVPLWIAEALRTRGVFYHLESLLSRSFDPWLHTGDAEVHMDCDQLVHLFTHVAWRLDLKMYEIQSPMHQYLTYQPPTGSQGTPLWVETTSFRRVDVHGERVDYMGAALGDDFLIDEDYHSSGKGGYSASRRIIEAGGLYQPSTDRDVQDSIVGNVLAGLEDEGIQAPVRAELEARVDGTRSYLVVGNLYTMLLGSARQELEARDFEAALRDGRQAVALHDRFGSLVLQGEPVDRVLVAQALLAQGADATAEIASLHEWYAENWNAVVPPRAHSTTHVDALLLFAALEGTPTLAECDKTFGAIMRYGLRFDSVPWTDRLCAQLSKAPACAPFLLQSGCP